MFSFLMFIAQVVLVVLWYVAPAFATVPAYVIFLPAIVYAIVYAVTIVFTFIIVYYLRTAGSL